MQLWDARWARMSILGDFQDGATAEVVELVSVTQGRGSRIGDLRGSFPQNLHRLLFTPKQAAGRGAVARFACAPHRWL